MPEDPANKELDLQYEAEKKLFQGWAQPSPVKNNLPAVWDLVLEDIAARDKMGQERYGTRLQPFNGRDMLRDVYEELLDAAVYIRAALFERDGK